MSHDRQQARTYTGREVGGAFVILLGVAIAGSGLVFNPVVARLWQGVYAVDKADVLASYFFWAVGIGGLIVWLGNAFSRAAPGSRVDRALVLGIPIALLVLADRFLLVEFGLPLWTHDPVLHYRQRPGVTRTLAPVGRPDAVISINQYGQHDTDFPLEKPEGELRGLMIGDSITMGDQLPYAETFSARLEDLLAQRDDAYSTHQIINTGVHGYSTYQEQIVLRESLRFQPDFVAIGFCMNDLSEPSVVKRGFEGAAVDYHRVMPTENRIYGYILNDTGFGRLSQILLARGRTRAGERRDELEAVRQMVMRPEDPEVERTYEFVLGDLAVMYDTAREAGIPVVLMIFPFTFQLENPAALAPQRILREHAEARGVSVLDFTPVFAREIFDDPEILGLLQQKGYGPEQVEQFYGARIREYFLDADHFTGKGHAVVAQTLLDHLVATGLIR